MIIDINYSEKNVKRDSYLIKCPKNEPQNILNIHSFPYPLNALLVGIKVKNAKETQGTNGNILGLREFILNEYEAS